MTRISIFSCLLASLFLVSCQKELDYDLTPEVLPEQGNDVPGGLLVKFQEDAINSSGNKESSIQQFIWDTSKRIREYNLSGIIDGDRISVRYRFTRAADGKLTKFVEDDMGAGISSSDSIVQKIVYQTGTSKLAYSLSTYYPSKATDSTAFKYNPAGRISQKEVFYPDGGVMKPQQNEIFNYDTNGNLTSQVIYSSGPSGYLPDPTRMNFTYGPHKAPGTLPGEDAFITSWLTAWVSPNFLTKKAQVYKNQTLTESDYSKETKFTNDGRPRSGKIYTGSESSTFSCTYQ